MIKKEMIWRHILYETLINKKNVFTQKALAEKFGFSTSTLFHSLKAPRKLGAVEVRGRFFRLIDAEKLLLLWATQRSFSQDIIYSTFVDAPIREIEGSMPSNIIFGGFSAYRLKYDEAPADYGVVYIYTDNLEEIKKRFPFRKGVVNLIVLKSDTFLHDFGKITPDVQTFVDLWNLSQWYAKDFLNALRGKIFSD